MRSIRMGARLSEQLGPFTRCTRKIGEERKGAVKPILIFLGLLDPEPFHSHEIDVEQVIDSRTAKFKRHSRPPGDALASELPPSSAG